MTADSTGPAADAVAADEAALLETIRQQPLPQHVAVIMDGNGRWAGLRGLPRVAGHREGVRAARETVRTAGRLGIGYLTLYAFSSENWTRPPAEVSFLMRLLESSVDEELPGLVENNVRLRTIGELASLDQGVRRSVERAARATESNTGLTLLIALNYGGPPRAGAGGADPGRRCRAGRAGPGGDRRGAALPRRSTPPACPTPTS